MKFKDYYQFRDWIENFIPLVYGKEELGLLRIEELLKRLGNPEKKFKSIHVAGTAGKGSTAFYIARLLAISNFQGTTLPEQPQGRSLKIGLHVSPHLSYVGERMQINGEVIPLTRLMELGNEIRPVVEGMKDCEVGLPSYFEILVAMSFMYFAQEKVDYAVVEVGLGGRLDATNVLVPEVSVITNIGLDHTEILGNTIEKIAGEKAGIIKPGVPVVTGAGGEALRVIEKIAKERGAEVKKITNAKYLITNTKYCTSETAALAVTAVETVLGEVSKVSKVSQVPKRAIEEAFGVGFAGRFEEIEPGVVLDGAHNVDKIRALIKWTTDYRLQTTVDSRPWTVVLVLGFKTGKNWYEMIDILLKDLPIREVVATQYQAVTDTGKGSAVKPREIAEYVQSVYGLQTTVYSNSQEAVWRAMTNDERLTTNDFVIVTGSLYLVGEVRTMWKLPEA